MSLMKSPRSKDPSGAVPVSGARGCHGEAEALGLHGRESQVFLSFGDRAGRKTSRCGDEMKKQSPVAIVACFNVLPRCWKILARRKKEKYG